MLYLERVLTKIRPHIIVATPGRFWELQSQGQDFLQNLNLVKYFVVDEADRMAQKGHFEELGSIIAAVGECQKFIFSATLTLTNKGSKRMEQKNIKADTSEMKLKKLMEIVGVEKKKSEVVDLSNKTLTAKGISEYKISCPSDKDKDHWLYWLLLKKKGRAIVFVNAISCALRLVLFLLLKINLFSRYLFCRYNTLKTERTPCSTRTSCSIVTCESSTKTKTETLG